MAAFMAPPAAEPHDLIGAGDRLQVGPLFLRRLRVRCEREVQIAAGWRQVVVHVVWFGHREHAPDLRALRRFCRRLEHDLVDPCVDGGPIAGRYGARGDTDGENGESGDVSCCLH